MTLREDDPMLKNVLGIVDAMDRLVHGAFPADAGRAGRAPHEARSGLHHSATIPNAERGK